MQLAINIAILWLTASAIAWWLISEGLNSDAVGLPWSIAFLGIAIGISKLQGDPK